MRSETLTMEGGELQTGHGFEPYNQKQRRYTVAHWPIPLPAMVLKKYENH